MRRRHHSASQLFQGLLASGKIWGGRPPEWWDQRFRKCLRPVKSDAWWEVPQRWQGAVPREY